MLRRWRRRDAAGSGTAIGVAILFPVLMLVIVSLSMLSESARIDQALQNTANRIAQSAALCCHFTGGPDGAQAVVDAALASTRDAASSNFILCNNDVVNDSSFVVVDVAGDDVAIAEDSRVPPGGTLYVFMTCRLRPQDLGGYGFPGLNVERTAVGIAAVDPYRARSGG